MIKLFQNIILSVAIAFIIAIIPAFPQNSSATVTSYKVTVLVYSGRPNPTYVIEDQQAVVDLNKELLNITIPELEESYFNQSGYIGLKIEAYDGNNKIREVIIPSRESNVNTTLSTKSAIDTDKIKSLEEKVIQYTKKENTTP